MKSHNSHLVSLVIIILIAGVITACGAAAPASQQEQASSEETAAEEESSAAEAEPAEEEAMEEAEEEVEAEEVAESSSDQSPVVVLYGSEADTFDPAHQAGSIGVVRNVFDTLLTKDEAGTLLPGIATEWSQLDDSTWEFKIREGVIAHNGEVIDANDVAYSLNRVLMPEIGAKGHYLWLAGNMRLAGAEAIDSQTVHLNTDGISGSPPELLWTWYILPQDHYESTPLEQLAREPLGSGPYKFVPEEARRGESYTLVANQDYWGEVPEVETLVFRIVPEMGTRIAEFNTGAADLLWLAPPPDLLDQIDPDLGRVVNVPGLRRVILGIVFYNDDAMQDKRVRQALNYGVDVQTIIDSLLFGQTDRSGSFVNPPNVPLSVQPYPYDPDKARELLQEAGFEDGDGDGFVEKPDGSPLEITLQTPNGTWVKDFEVAQAVAADLQRIGVNVEVEPMEFATYIGSLADGSATGELWFQAASGGYGCQADTSDFSNHTQWQPGKWVHQEFDDLFQELTQAVDIDERQELCYQLQEIMSDEAPLIFLYNQVDPYAMSHRIEWTPFSHGRNNFADMKWAE